MYKKLDSVTVILGKVLTLRRIWDSGSTSAVRVVRDIECPWTRNVYHYSYPTLAWDMILGLSKRDYVSLKHISLTNLFFFRSLKWPLPNTLLTKDSTCILYPLETNSNHSVYTIQFNSKHQVSRYAIPPFRQYCVFLRANYFLFVDLYFLCYSV
jgi:hypothetical protein